MAQVKSHMLYDVGAAKQNVDSCVDEYVDALAECSGPTARKTLIVQDMIGSLQARANDLANMQGYAYYAESFAALTITETPNPSGIFSIDISKDALGPVKDGATALKKWVNNIWNRTLAPAIKKTEGLAVEGMRAAREKQVAVFDAAKTVSRLASNHPTAELVQIYEVLGKWIASAKKLEAQKSRAKKSGGKK